MSRRGIKDSTRFSLAKAIRGRAGADNSVLVCNGVYRERICPESLVRNAKVQRQV